MSAQPDSYLGRGVCAGTILRHAADQGRKHCAPVDMIERFDAAASVYAATGSLPDWAQPSHDVKTCVLPVLKEDESE